MVGLATRTRRKLVQKSFSFDVALFPGTNLILLFLIIHAYLFVVSLRNGNIWMPKMYIVIRDGSGRIRGGRTSVGPVFVCRNISSYPKRFYAFYLYLYCFWQSPSSSFRQLSSPTHTLQSTIVVGSTRHPPTLPCVWLQLIQKPFDK